MRNSNSNSPKLRERRFDLESDGRKIKGVAVRYGDVAKLPWGNEKIAPGALDFDDVILNLHHNRSAPLARTNGGGLSVVDDGQTLRLEADLPDIQEANDALTLIRKRVLRGLSMEFTVDDEVQQGDTVEVLKGKLVNVAIVDRPAYPDSYIEARRAELGTEEEEAEKKTNGVVKRFYY